MKPNLFVLVTLAAAALTLASCSSTSELPPPVVEHTSMTFEEGVPGGTFVNTVQLSAKVTAINRADRKLTLLGPDGDTVEVKVGPEAVNFNQIKVGDTVNAAVTEELVISLGDEADAQPDGSAAVVARAREGEKPAAVAAETRQVTGTVTAIDQKKRTATLKFEDGTTKTFPVRSDIDLSQQKLGQKVVFKVTGMVALSVEKP